MNFKVQCFIFTWNLKVTKGLFTYIHTCLYNLLSFYRPLFLFSLFSFLSLLCIHTASIFFFQPRSQSYDRELQRQRCKNLQRHYLPRSFWKKKLFLLWKNVSAYYNASDVVVNSKVVGLAPGLTPKSATAINRNLARFKVELWMKEEKDQTKTHTHKENKHFQAVKTEQNLGHIWI
jgi:hypothetical protein